MIGKKLSKRHKFSLWNKYPLSDEQNILKYPNCVFEYLRYILKYPNCVFGYFNIHLRYSNI
jgi:hypothetical protein